MSKQLPEITPDLAAWIKAQRLFFVASAPLSSDGHVNVSPKGGDSFRILSPSSVAYLDYTGSGAETAAHLRENGRIVVMFCAFEGTPRIARLHGRGELIEPAHDEFNSLSALFPAHPGTRAVIRVAVERVSTSCGFGIPFYAYNGERDALEKFAETKGPEGMVDYRRLKNVKSIDGLPALAGE